MNRLLQALLVPLAMWAATAAQAQPEATTPPATALGATFTVNHVALRTADLERAVRFWRQNFGATEVRRSRIPNIDAAIEIVFLHISGGFHIELVGGGTPQALPPARDIADDYRRAGWRHVAFSVHDLDATLARLAAGGVKAEYRITRADYGLHIALLRDPDGNFVELYAPLAP